MFFRSSGGAFLSGGAAIDFAAVVVSGIGGGGACSEGFSSAGFFGDEVWALRTNADANATAMTSRRFISFGPLELLLPNINSLVRGPDHRRALRNIERLLEFVEVRERNERAETSRRMRVRVQPQLQVFIALRVAPNLGVTQKESLFRREPVDLRLRPFLGHCFLERHERALHATDVRDVFALGQLAVDVQSRQRLAGAVLRDD